MIEKIVLFLKCACTLHAGGKFGIIAHVFNIIRIMIGMQCKQHNGRIFASRIGLWRKFYGNIVLFFMLYIKLRNEFFIFWEYKRGLFRET